MGGHVKDLQLRDLKEGRRLGSSALAGQMVREGRGGWQEGGKQTQKEEVAGWERERPSGTIETPCLTNLSSDSAGPFLTRP